MKTRLGKGLGALLSGGPLEAPGQGGPAPQAAEERDQGASGVPGADDESAPAILEVELSRIQPNPDQPRRTFDPGALEELRNSIQNHGLLQPVVLRRVEGGFELIAGERRWRAARLAGLERVPAVVRQGVDEGGMLELALVENVQRQDLDPIERARGYGQMVERLGLTQDQVAQRVGLKRATVANHIRLLDLPTTVQEAVAQGRLSMGHARAILGLDAPDADKIGLATTVASRDLSVRETERVVRERNQLRRGTPRPGAGGSGAKAPVSRSQEPWIRDAEDRMRRALGTKVRLDNRAGYRGQIVVDYYSREDLERLLIQLAPKPELEDGSEQAEAS